MRAATCFSKTEKLVSFRVLLQSTPRGLLSEGPPFYGAPLFTSSTRGGFFGDGKVRANCPLSTPLIQSTSPAGHPPFLGSLAPSGSPCTVRITCTEE